VLFGAYFWLWLRAVALKPEKKEALLPMGIVFMFDRLLPAYQIRADHYDVDQFYKRVPKAKQAEVPPDQRREINYFGLKLVVIPMNEAERRKIDRTLDILKVVGLVLAVFFVAAINAIVSR